MPVVLKRVLVAVAVIATLVWVLSVAGVLPSLDAVRVGPSGRRR